MTLGLKLKLWAWVFCLPVQYFLPFKVHMSHQGGPVNMQILSKSECVCGGWGRGRVPSQVLLLLNRGHMINSKVLVYAFSTDHTTMGSFQKASCSPIITPLPTFLHKPSLAIQRKYRPLTSLAHYLTFPTFPPVSEEETWAFISSPSLPLASPQPGILPQGGRWFRGCSYTAQPGSHWLDDLTPVTHQL